MLHSALVEPLICMIGCICFKTVPLYKNFLASLKQGAKRDIADFRLCTCLESMKLLQTMSACAL
jgi:hypothetical protein